jgi:hypothetical protein
MRELQWPPRELFGLTLPQLHCLLSDEPPVPGALGVARTAGEYERMIATAEARQQAEVQAWSQPV